MNASTAHHEPDSRQPTMTGANEDLAVRHLTTSQEPSPLRQNRLDTERRHPPRPPPIIPICTVRCHHSHLVHELDRVGHQVRQRQHHATPVCYNERQPCVHHLQWRARIRARAPRPSTAYTPFAGLGMLWVGVGQRVGARGVSTSRLTTHHQPTPTWETSSPSPARRLRPRPAAAAAARHPPPHPR
jgi:hypothetical protein